MNTLLRFLLILFLLPTSYTFAQPTADMTWQELHKQMVTLFWEGRYKQAIPYGEAAQKKAAMKPVRKYQLQFAATADTLGLLYRGENNMEKADTFLQAALQIRQKREGENHPHYASTLMALAGLYQLQEKFDTAITISLQALAIRQKTVGENHIDYAECVGDLAEIYRKVNNPQTDSLFLKAIDIYEKNGKVKEPSYLSALNNFAVYYNDKGENVKAQFYFEKAVDISKKYFQNQIYTLDPLINLGGIYTLLGYYDKGDSLTKQALSILKAYNREESMEYSMILNVLAIIELKKRNGTSAINYLNEALSLQKKIFGEKHLFMATTLSNMGQSYETINEHLQAHNCYTQSYLMLKALGMENSEAFATALNNDASLYGSQGNFIKEEALHLQTLAIRKKVLGDTTAYYAQSLNNLALCYEHQKRYEEAEKMYLQAMYIFQKQQMLYDYTGSLQNLALLHFNKKEYNKAKPLYEQAASLMESIVGKAHWRYAIVLHNIALVYMAEKEYDKADSLQEIGMKIYEKGLGKDNSEYAITLYKVAQCNYLRGNFDKSYHSYLQANNLSYNHFLHNQLGMSESERRKFWADTKRYGQFFYFFTEKNYLQHPEVISEAYNYSLKTKGIIYTQTSNALRAIEAQGDSTLIRDIAAWKTQKVQVATWSNWSIKKRGSIDLAQEINKANEMESKIAQKSALFQASIDTTNIDWQQVQHALQPGEASVEILYFRLPNEAFDALTTKVMYVALILTPETQGKPMYVPFENGNELDKMDSLYQRAIKSNNPTALQSLYELYWQPIAAHLRSAKKIYFAPDGIYNTINLNTLIDKTGKYVIETTDIQILASTRDLAVKKKSLPNLQKSIVLIGNPTFNLSKANMERAAQAFHSKTDYAVRGDDRGNFDALPHAEQEVKDIAKLLRKTGWKVDIYVRDSALEEYVKTLNSPTVLHIATHGYVNRKRQDSEQKLNNPNASVENALLQSGVLLAGAQTTEKADSILSSEDGWLSSYETANLLLQGTELVVLSACGTGLGRIDGGEGVIGLQSAFRMAGAKNVLMSLWSVPDIETAELMADFYTLWVSGKTIHEALRAAQLKRVGKMPVEKWGAFVHLGHADFRR